jgi:hypothetical protein
VAALRLPRASPREDRGPTTTAAGRNSPATPPAVRSRYPA